MTRTRFPMGSISDAITLAIEVAARDCEIYILRQGGKPVGALVPVVDEDHAQALEQDFKGRRRFKGAERLAWQNLTGDLRRLSVRRRTRSQ